MLAPNPMTRENHSTGVSTLMSSSRGRPTGLDPRRIVTPIQTTEYCGDGPEETKDRPFDQNLSNEPPPAPAECGSHREFLRSIGGARQE